METNKKLFSLIILSLILGSALGFYFGNKHFEGIKKVIITNPVSEEVCVSVDENKKNLILQEIDLLKSYTDFVLLPKEKIADPKKYADEMGAKVEAINNDDITAKFYATGETEDKEQKIVDFLDFLSEKIKADLQ
jgi:hypothetical protein